MHPLVILVDVDNTLLEGDAVRALITNALTSRAAGPGGAAAFWAHYEAVRSEFGGADVPVAALRLEQQYDLAPGAALATIEAADFASCLHPGALEALEHLGGLGLTVVLSDGNARYQRRKIAAAGIEAAVEGRVLVVPHKEQALALVLAQYPAAHYALLDDRAGILGAVKAQLAERVTTVWLRQGRYADDPVDPGLPPPDLELPSIEAALGLSAADLAATVGGAGGPEVGASGRA